MSCLHGDDLRSNPGKNADTPPGSKMPSHTEAEREQCASARQLPLGGTCHGLGCWLCTEVHMLRQHGAQGLEISELGCKNMK